MAAASATAAASDETASAVPRTRTGCQNCRLRHLKCDDRKPGCTRCLKSSIECVRGYNIRFKHGSNPSVANLKGSGLAKTDYDFSDSQPWVRTDRNLTFLDETPELNSLYDRDCIDVIAYGPDKASAKQQQQQPQPPKPQSQARSLPVSDQPIQHATSKQQQQKTASSSPDRLVPAIATPANSAPTNSPGNFFGVDDSRFHENTAPEKRRRLTTSGYVSYTDSFHGSAPSSSSPGQMNQSPTNFWDNSSHSRWTPASIDANLEIGPHNAASDPAFAGLQPSMSFDTGAAFATVSDSFSRIYLDAPIWPLKDKEEARLLRYFVEHLARSFDLTDPLQHFRRVVPQRAASCPPLLNAIFALSARHLSRIGEYDHLISNKYIQGCLQHLIPMLDDSSALQDENLLASTIILRHVEELEVPLSGQRTTPQQESHLFGAHAFITAQERATITGGLRQAAFWVGLRQEIYVAFVNQRSIIPALEHCNIDRSFEAASDDVWACRMVVLAADIIRYCFGDHDHPQSTYSFLVDCATQWFASKPASFTPVYEQAAGEESVFPEFCYVADDVVVGTQHYYLAKILLIAHNPKIPRLGPLRTAALKTADAEIMEYVRILCGICISNPNSPPNFIYAAMAIVIAGEKFTDRREQDAVVDILLACDSKHAWGTGTVIETLKVSWGWDAP